MLPLLAWVVVAVLLDGWLTPRAWPKQRNNPLVFGLTLGLGLAVTVAWRVSADRVIAERLRRNWKSLTGPELIWMAVAVVWLAALTSVMSTAPSLLFQPRKPWFDGTALLVLGGLLVFGASMMQAISGR
jgi:hypothetical protein